MKFRWPLFFVVISLLMISCTTSIHQDSRTASQFVPANVPYSSITSLPYNQPSSTLFYGENALQFGKLWLPKRKIAQQTLSPLVIFIHGGCWLNAYSIDHSFPLTSALAENGVMVWSLEYRRTGDQGGGWPGTFNDVLQGIQTLLQQTQYEFDKSNVILVGHSAGGHLALLAQNALATEDKIDVEISTVIGLAAISNLTKYAAGDNSCQKAVGQFMGGDVKDNPLNYMQADPAQQLIASTPSTQRLLLHGTADSIVPLSQSREVNFKAHVVEVAEAGHFDWLHPQSESFRVLLNLISDNGK